VHYSSIRPVSHYWRSSQSVSSSSSCSWADIISTCRISTIPATTAVSRTTSRVFVGNWTTTGCICSGAGGLGQCRTSGASSYCAASSVVRRKHGLRVLRHLALQLSVWTHRFHTGRLVYLFTTTCTLVTFDQWQSLVRGCQLQFFWVTYRQASRW